MFETFLGTLQREFAPSTYDIFNHNCNHFSERALRFLAPKARMPDYVLQQVAIIRKKLGRGFETLVDALGAALTSAARAPRGTIRLHEASEDSSTHEMEGTRPASSGEDSSSRERSY